jgi:hypothetical protein
MNDITRFCIFPHILCLEKRNPTSNPITEMNVEDIIDEITNTPKPPKTACNRQKQVNGKFLGIHFVKVIHTQ